MATLCKVLRSRISVQKGSAKSAAAAASLHTSALAQKRLNFENDYTPSNKEYLLLDSDRSGSDVAFNWSLVINDVPPCNEVEKNPDAARLAKIYRSKDGVLNGNSTKEAFELKQIPAKEYGTTQLKVAQYLSEEVQTLYVNDLAAGSQAPYLHLRVISDDPFASAFAVNALSARNANTPSDQIIGKPSFVFPKEIPSDLLIKQGVDLKNTYDNNSTIYVAVNKPNESAVFVSPDGNRATVVGSTSTVALRKAIGFSAIAGYLSKGILAIESEVVKGTKGNHVLVANAPESPKESPLGFHHHLWGSAGLSRFWAGVTTAGKAEKTAPNAFVEKIGDSVRTTQPLSAPASLGHPSHFVIVADDKSSPFSTLTKLTPEQANKVVTAGHIGNPKAPFRPFPILEAAAYGNLVQSLTTAGNVPVYVINVSAGGQSLNIVQLKSIVDAIANGEADSAPTTEIGTLGFHSVTALGKLPLAKSANDVTEAHAAAFGLSKPKA